MSEYGIEHVLTFEGTAAIRKRPGMYVASVEQDGVHHITLEILSNAIDEYLAGICTEINVSVKENNEITIEDNGRGVPFGKKTDGSETLENIFTKLHTGAKFNSDGTAAYNSSGGLNGVGAKATNALSSYFIVESSRNGERATMSFKKGKRDSFNILPIDSAAHGTKITFMPDSTIFKNTIELDEARLFKQVQEFSFLCPNLLINLKFKNKPAQKIISVNGLVDYVNTIAEPEEQITKIFSVGSVEERYSISIALCYTKKYSEQIKLYTNNIPNIAGTHLTGFRAAMTRAVNDLARELKILKEKDDNLTGEDLKEGLCLILSLKMPEPVFNGQTKDVLTSSDARTIVEKLLNRELRFWFEQNVVDLRSIVDKALLSRRAREAAKKAREAIREKDKSGLITGLHGKLTDCISRKTDETELFIVEGQSAGSGAKAARDKQFQAVLPIQGKLLNSEKNDVATLLKNKEVQALVTAVGCGFGESFDYSKLRYNKVIIMADADEHYTSP